MAEDLSGGLLLQFRSDPIVSGPERTGVFFLHFYICVENVIIRTSMTRQKKAERDLKLIEYLKTNTLFMTALKFDLSTNQVWRIKEAFKQKNGLLEQP